MERLRLSPCGESGLKCGMEKAGCVLMGKSLPMRGEWIEIAHGAGPDVQADQSLPMRGEWIEIRWRRSVLPRSTVSPHAGRVD